MNKLPFENNSNKTIKRYSSETNFSFGKKPEDRDIKELMNFGVINLDKPSGPTSHEAADTVKRILTVSSCGHGGTLDPRVTGVLPIALNKATRLLQVFLHGGKEYVCEMKLHAEVSKKDILAAFNKFTGKIRQLPPIKSNVKRVLRDRTIYYINLLEYEPRTVLFRVGCEAGTYIRKLCTDMGDYLKVKAHMQDLRRTQASCFKEEDSFNMFDVQDALTLYNEKGDESLLRKVILPAEYAVKHLKKIIASDGGVAAVSYGATLMLPGVVEISDDINKGDFVAMFSLKGELASIGEALMSTADMVKNSKGECFLPNKVFIEAGVYPRSWKDV